MAQVVDEMKAMRHQMGEMTEEVTRLRASTGSSMCTML